MRPLAALSFILCLLLSGCGDDRKPVPVLNIRVMADGTYTLNREPMKAEKLREEIQRVADENRRAIGSTTRVYVRVATQAGASQADKSMVVNACVAAGINSIEQSSVDE
jgi:biopolymer transport protein ExbD